MATWAHSVSRFFQRKIKYISQSLRERGWRAPGTSLDPPLVPFVYLVCGVLYYVHL